MKVALYARVSTEQQSPDLQLEDLRAWCKMRGWNIVKEYIDVDQSGAKESRPALDCLMLDARRRRFNAVLVWRFDRFARSLLHLVKALNEFQGLGLEFVSQQEAIDTSCAGGRLIFQVFGAIAEFERAVLRDRVKAGLRAARAKGKRLGRPPIPYNDFMEHQVREYRLKGLTDAAISRRLGIATRTMNRRFPPSPGIGEKVILLDIIKPFDLNG